MTRLRRWSIRVGEKCLLSGFFFGQNAKCSAASIKQTRQSWRSCARIKVTPSRSIVLKPNERGLFSMLGALRRAEKRTDVILDVQRRPL